MPIFQSITFKVLGIGVLALLMLIPLAQVEGLIRALGGTLDDPKEVSPGEWKSKTATGGTRVEIKKGDLIFVPRGTPHQRTVTGKGFSMILVKIFADRQPVK